MKNTEKMRKIESFFVFSIFLLSIYAAEASEPVPSSYVRCLIFRSNPRFPIVKAIYTSMNHNFSAVLQSYIRNERFSTFETPKPVAIITALHESHVQATIFCSKHHGFQLRIRSGGHDYEGLSYVSDVPFVVLDLFNLFSINFHMEEETAWVEAGVTLGEFNYNIAKKSSIHGFPEGVCPTVAVGGHYSGGGYGNLMRKFGLSIDNIIDAILVDVNGRILDRAAMGEDLFWAIRGGGGASFGVILSWKVKLVRLPPKVTVFNVQKTAEEEDTLDVIYDWQTIAPNLDPNLFIRAMQEVVNGTSGGRKTIRVSFVGMFLGEAANLLSLMNSSFPQLGLEKKDCIETSWIESTLIWAGFPKGTSPEALLDRPTHPASFFKSRSDYVKNPIPKQAIRKIWDLMIEVEKVPMQWNPYGGRMGEISPAETPFPHRKGNLYLIQYPVNWVEEGIEASNYHRNLSKTVHQAMTPFVSKSPRESFLNYRDLDIGANPSNFTSFETARIYGRKYFKDNFDRLVRVKTMIDPQNFFRNEQSIPPYNNIK